ncbi:MAG: hypothetical protein WCK78_06880 [Paludibacter sp.]
MKNLIIGIITVVVLISCSISKSVYVNGVRIPDVIPFSKFKGDTAAYLQTNIENRKAYYIGKEVDVLLKDVEQPIKSFIFTTSRLKIQGKSKINGMNLYFYDEDKFSKAIDTKKFIPSISLDFMSPYMDLDTFALILTKNNNKYWSPEMEMYIRKQRIEKVQYFDGGIGNK